MAEGNKFVPYIHSNVRGMSAWNPTTPLVSERPDRTPRMDLNDCPYPPSPSVVVAMRDFADKVNRYPDGGLPRLTARIPFGSCSLVRCQNNASCQCRWFFKHTRLGSCTSGAGS